MLDKLKLQKALTSVFFIASALGVAGFFFSPFLVSLCTIVLVLCYLPLIGKGFTTSIKSLLPIVVLLFFGLLDFFRSHDPGLTGHKVALIATFLLLSLAFGHYLKSKSPVIAYCFAAIFGIVLFVNLHAVVNYLLNKEAIDVLLTQSKSIPLINNIHHIHFGILNAISIVALFYFIAFHSFFRSQKKLWYIVLGLLLVCFHVLSSRTGLLAFYSSIVMALVVYAIQSKRIKPLIYGVIILFGTLGITYGLSSSFRAKVANSVEDFESWGQSDKINYKSMAMRIEAYKNCLHLISDNPLFGVGADKMESRMATEYNNMNTTLYLENRIGPHNQFLEFGVKYGVLGIVLLVWYLFTLVNDSGKPILIIVVFILIVSLLFESLLERQMSIYFMALFAELARSFSIR